jgi:hypothetical protein
MTARGSSPREEGKGKGSGAGGARCGSWRGRRNVGRHLRKLGLGPLYWFTLGVPVRKKEREVERRRKRREENEEKKNMEIFPKLKNFVEKNKTQFMGLV